MSLVALATRRRVTIAMATLAVLLFGTVALSRLNVNLLPDLAHPALTIRTELEGAAPAEIENLITKPVEEALGVVAPEVADVPGVALLADAQLLLADRVEAVGVEFGELRPLVGIEEVEDDAALDVRPAPPGVPDLVHPREPIRVEAVVLVGQTVDPVDEIGEVEVVAIVYETAVSNEVAARCFYVVRRLRPDRFDVLDFDEYVFFPRLGERFVSFQVDTATLLVVPDPLCITADLGFEERVRDVLRAPALSSLEFVATGGLGGVVHVWEYSLFELFHVALRIRYPDCGIVSFRVDADPSEQLHVPIADGRVLGRNSHARCNVSVTVDSTRKESSDVRLRHPVYRREIHLGSVLVAERDPETIERPHRGEVQDVLFIIALAVRCKSVLPRELLV